MISSTRALPYGPPKGSIEAQLSVSQRRSNVIPAGLTWQSGFKCGEETETERKTREIDKAFTNRVETDAFDPSKDCERKTSQHPAAWTLVKHVQVKGAPKMINLPRGSLALVVALVAVVAVVVAA